MADSARVTNGSLTQGSVAIFIEVDGEATSDTRLIRDGHYIQTYNQLQVSTRQLIRSHDDDIILIGGKPFSEAYNDTIQFQNFSSASIDKNTGEVTYSISKVFMNDDGQGALERIPSHKQTQYVYGQTEIYNDDEPYFENTDPSNAVEILSTHSYNLFLPASLVDHSSVSALDGVIQPLLARSLIDLNSIDFPFTALGVKGSVGEAEGPRKKTSFIGNPGYNIDDAKIVPFLDAIEGMGGVSFPTVINTTETKIKPFNDTLHYRDVYFTKQAKKGIAVSSDMSNIIKSGSFVTWDIEDFEKYPAFGSDYLDGPDSIAFGGLKK